MIPNLEPLAVTGDTPVPLIDLDLIKLPSGSTNAFATLSGWSLFVTTDAVAHIGDSDMDRDNTSPMPAGTYSFTFRDDEVPYVLSADTGDTVNIGRLAQGLKAEGSSPGGGGGFGGGGFGE